MVYKAYTLQVGQGVCHKLSICLRHLDLFVALIHAAEESCSPHLKRFPDISNIQALRFQALGLLEG